MHRPNLAPACALLLACKAAALVSAPTALAVNVESRTGAPEPFALGEIVVTAARSAEAIPIGAQAVGQEALRVFGRVTLDEATRLIPGVTGGTTGGRRNERLVLVRGFNQFQAPLSIDGVRVYLPADARLDFGRFLTLDVAEIQVAKGYVSVVDGPDALGGAINLVTRTPARPLELEGLGALTLDGRGARSSADLFGFAGTRQQRWYAQASAAWSDRSHWRLPASCRPTPAEDCGRRDFSDSSDWRMAARIGFTPRDGNEYALSIIQQSGQKNAPLHVRDPVALQSNWTWPWWDVRNIYFLSSTTLGEMATLRTRLYWNSFDNLLRAFDDRTQTTQTRPRAFDSYYADRSIGGSVTLDIRPDDATRVSTALHARNDRHTEYQTLFFPARFTEPRQTSSEDSYSAAIEGERALGGGFGLRGGVAYDWRDLRRAADFVGNTAQTGRFIIYPLANSDALSWQAALGWRDGEAAGASHLRLSVSRRTRFPTLFNRFSTQFNGAVSNPRLKPETARTLELAGATTLGPARLEGAIFWSDVRDLILPFPLIVSGQPATQSRNLGSADYCGAELGLSAGLTPRLDAGLTWTWVERDGRDPTNPAFRPTGIPIHQGLVWLDWRPLDELRLTPSLDWAGRRWTVTTDGRRYYRSGDHVLVGARMAWAASPAIELAVAGRNLTDARYELVDGFPEPGRSVTFSATLRR
jgi:iron complex outermembrane receptor protein